MKNETKRRIYAAIDGAARTIDVAGALYHDPRRYTRHLVGRSVESALIGDSVALSIDGRRATSSVTKSKKLAPAT